MRGENKPACVTVRFALSISGQDVEASARLPAGPVTVTDLLPVLHGISNMIVAAAEQQAAERGKRVSCRAGCGVCCRQLVPIAESEARYLAALIDSMPEPRREHVRRRFRDAVAAIEPSGMLDRLRRVAQVGMDERFQLGIDYFKLDVACPFLEEESCSIHERRPTACREYLVSSPPDNCRTPRADLVEEIPLAARPSWVLCRFGDLRGEDELRLVPLVLLLEWVEAHRGDPELKAQAPDLLMNFINRITGAKTPPSESLEAKGVVERRQPGHVDAGT